MRLSRVLRAPLLLALAAAVIWANESGRLFKQARKAEKAGDYTDAYLLYSKARGFEPAKRKYIWAAEGVRELAMHALQSAGLAASSDATDALLNTSLEPSQPIPMSDVAEARHLRPPVELEPDRKHTDLLVKGTIQQAYEQVAREFGLDVLFDSEYQGSDQVRFELTDTSFQQAILALNDVANSFVIPVSPKLFLVAADNPTKRAELEPVIAVLQPVPDTVTPEEVTELGQAVQQTLEMKRFQIDTTRRQVFMRDTVTRVRLAQALLQHLAQPRGQVVLEVELLAVSDSTTLTLGLGLPSSFPVVNLSTIWNNQPSVTNTVGALLGIGGGRTVFGLAIGAANLVARKLSSSSQLLQQFNLRATHGMPAKLHLGERYPIVNARFSPVVIDDNVQGSIDNGTFREPFPSFTFEDLGLVMNVTPQIHSADEVTLDLEVQFRLLSGSTSNEIPVIANREFHTFARLKEGEVALISGMAVSQNFNTRSGVVLLSEIPWLGKLFTRNVRDEMVSDLIIAVRPRIVRLPPAELGPTLVLRYGPEGRPLSSI